jgi:kynurenine formamidase
MATWLGYLDQLRGTQLELIVLPLRIVDGDGSPARAIAIETVPA